MEHPEVRNGIAAVDYYFLEESGESFKASVMHDPYFFVYCKPGYEPAVEEYLKKLMEGLVKKYDWLEKEDLSLPNHLIGYKRTLLKLSFFNVTDLLAARKLLQPLAAKNKKRQDIAEGYEEVSLASLYDKKSSRSIRDAAECILDLYEYDVPYHVRVSIDKNIRVGKWYNVEIHNGSHVQLTELVDRVTRADPVVMAFDIETTKLPLKFPDAAYDQVMMISYMIDGQGFLITNREIVSTDIENFEYTPKQEFTGEFHVYNEANEAALLNRFFWHIKTAKPTVIATFNGDFFDWPFVEKRAAVYAIDMYDEIGFKIDSEEEYKSTYCVHMDCFRWVKRDSYLPQGSQGLKAVTTVKLGYNPSELDPELMTPYASEQPQILAEYSVSDAVATYYLYMKYVHPFIFSLCNIIPLNPDETLRKGTGTLCEMLLMVQAYQGNILLPHKHTEPLEQFYHGHLLNGETYVGGHVESLEAGVFRSDIESEFTIDSTAVQELIDQLNDALEFTIEVENNCKLDDVTNFEQVKKEILDKLTDLRDHPFKRLEKPLIYHVDVASMYPNIMTTNRLQPDSIVTEEICASCDFNRPGKTCDRRLPWSWRGEFLPPGKSEYLMVKHAVAAETFPPAGKFGKPRTFEELSAADQSAAVRKRLTEYSRKVYHKIRDTKIVERQAIVCQRENPFYVNTVRAFRDRRYEFKGLQKKWKKKADELSTTEIAAKEEAKKMVVLYDSLQLAHKVILNSFYGYVMRKGSRWYSMEMAGVTCLTGATIIQLARSLVERLGRPLELDTDGIWCILPQSFPENFTFQMKNGQKSIFFSYPCAMLNHLVHKKFTNHQYQTLTKNANDQSYKFETTSDNSIFFELDGPYRAMILPSSQEEGVNLKKRYAVFNEDGSLAELKGFEVKRRGELRLIKAFQSQLFKTFLEGQTLIECYAAVAKVADSWLDILDLKGASLNTSDLLDLISENKSMSKSLEEYGSQKSTSITTARRLAEFLGSQITKDKGLNCKYVIARDPVSQPVSERAIPVIIFSAESAHRRQYLSRWLKDPGLVDCDPRNIIDWKYYITRLGSAIQKIITIPAALQGLDNPVPRVPYPDWLKKQQAQKNSNMKQLKIGSLFKNSGELPRKEKTLIDIEDLSHDSQGDASDSISFVQKKRNLERSSSNRASDDLLLQLKNQISVETQSYKEVLSFHKAKWRAQQIERTRRAQLFGKPMPHNTNSMGISKLIQERTISTFTTQWRLIQLRESKPTGSLKAWVSIAGRIQSVTIIVPRRFYVNFQDKNTCGIEIPDSRSVLVPTHIMPNGLPSDTLKMITMSEERFEEEIGKSDSILHDRNVVDAIYETCVDSLSRALLELGSSCTLDESKPGLLGRGLETGFEIDWLKMSSPDSISSLGDSLKGFQYILLTHISAPSEDSWHVYVLLPSWSCHSGQVFVLRPSTTAEALPNMTKLFSAQLLSKERCRPSSTYVKYAAHTEFEELYFDNPQRLYQRIGASLNRLQQEMSSKAMLLLQANNPDKLRNNIRQINDLPIVEFKSRIPSNLFSSLNWQSTAAKTSVQNLLDMDEWLQHLESLSSFCNIPICNVASMKPRKIIDILYGRRLLESKSLLWWSPKVYDCAIFEPLTATQMQSIVEFVELPTINRPGHYDKVSIDMKFRNLHVNTVLTTVLIANAEGGNVASSFLQATTNQSSQESSTSAAKQTPFIENFFSTPAMFVLSNMLRDWWNDATKGIETADYLTTNFMTWVSSSESRLFNADLYHQVQQLTKKSFIQLALEMKRLGSGLIFANGNRILVSTSKHVVENAYAYGQFLTKTIRSRPLFRFLDIEVTDYWDNLIWLDAVNYGGRSCKEITAAKEQELEIQLYWHMKRYLPPVLKDDFDEWVLEFLRALIHAKERLSHATQANSFLMQHKSVTNDSESTLAEEDIEQDEDEESCVEESILKDISPSLIRRIKQLQRRYVDGAGNAIVAKEFEFPSQPGSYFVPAQPVLELCKYLCAIFSLCPKLELEVIKLKRTLYKIFDVLEFSPEAAFKDPSASLKIHQLCCESCANVKDLDICKDDDFAHLSSSDSGSGKSHYVWLCECCGKEYDRTAIEELLIREIQRQHAAYQLQDLKCVKCSRTRQYDLSEHCACSGAYVETIPRQHLSDTYKVFGNVAKFYELGLLQETIEALS